MKFAFILAAAAVSMFAADRGLKPRPGPADYPAHDAANEVTVAAAILNPDQVKATFSTELKDYLVLEVGVYPGTGKTLDLNTADFVLRAGDRGDLIRAANPRAIAASNQRKNQPQATSGGRDITLYPTATVGVASGRDPWTGRRNTGVYSGAGVGVGVGGSGGPMGPDPPRPASTDQDREVMREELTDQMLPDGATTAPVAGYLYFPMPAKARTAALELHYYGQSDKVRVSLPPLPKR
jgi:hypothetical protein